MLNQTTYDFSNIWESWQIARDCTWFSNINQSIQIIN